MYEKVLFCLQHRVSFSNVLILVTFGMLIPGNFRQPFDITHEYGNKKKNSFWLKYIPSNFTQEVDMISLVPTPTYLSLIVCFHKQQDIEIIIIFHLTLNQCDILFYWQQCAPFSETVSPWHVTVLSSGQSNNTRRFRMLATLGWDLYSVRTLLNPSLWLAVVPVILYDRPTPPPKPSPEPYYTSQLLGLDLA